MANGWMGEKRDNYSIYLKMLKEHFLNLLFDLGKKTPYQNY